MNRYTGFSDLCIPEASTENLKPIIREAIELGYRNVAIEQMFDVTETDDKNKKQDAVPAAYPLMDLNAEFGGQIRLLNRLTVIFVDASVSLVLNKSTNIRGYNIVAALPLNDASMQYACQTMACDIVTYNDSTHRVKLSRNFYFLAVERNIAFEIKYAPTIVRSQDRRATINRAHRYHSFGKSKNVLISSEATNAFQLRSPYDIANLGLIFGLSEEQSKQAIRDVPNRILLSAAGRRFGKAGVVITRRGKKDNAVDSDDYSDSELNEDISDTDDDDDCDDVSNGNEDDEAMDDTAGGMAENVDDSVEMEPPRKMAKQEKAHK